MSFFDKLKNRFARKPLSPDTISEIAQETADKKNESFFARYYREARQYRLDARIRRELGKTRAYAIASRPRTMQAGTKVVGQSKDYLELANGQRICEAGPLRNPVLRNLRDSARGESVTRFLKAA